MPNLLEKIRTEVEEIIKEYFRERGLAEPSAGLERPADWRHGHLATGLALRYAQTLNQPPLQLAEELAVRLRARAGHNLEKAEVAPPGFVNLFFSSAVFSQALGEILSAPDDYGRNDDLRGQKWVVEHTSPNPNKAMHLGHLRNNLIGMSLVRLLEWSGATVVADAVDNNRGVAIAKLMWGFLSRMRVDETAAPTPAVWRDRPIAWQTPESAGLRPDEFVSRCYVLGEEDYRARPEAQTAVRDLVSAWEANDAATRALWAHVLAYAYAGINRTLTRLGNRWDKVWHEHEHYELGKRWVEIGLERGIFRRLEDGAVLTDLADYRLPDTVLLKNDGGSLYITQDVALTAEKKKSYGADKLIWVIGAEQTLALKQVFAVCEQLGIGRLGDFTHVSYGYVGLKAKDGGFKKMSSRTGTVVLIDDLIDEVRERLLPRSGELAEVLALAAVKFGFLKAEREQNTVFDVAQSVRTDGDSGIYVIYTYARIQSLLRERPVLVLTPPRAAILGSLGELVGQLGFFPETVRRAREDYSPHHLVQSLLSICAAFNRWYGREKILDGGADETNKLAVARATAAVIKNGLVLLGINPIDRI